MEKKIKHLEFIQNVITRMNTCSFVIKGWTITLVSALFALAANDSNLKFTLISYLVIPIFWILDGFFVASERRFRDLYNEVILIPEENIDFSMSVNKFEESRTWPSGILSHTLIPFYGMSLLITLIIIQLLF